MASKPVSAPPVQAGLLRSTLNVLLKPRDKKLEKEKALKKDILQRQSKLLREEIVQQWKIVIGEEVPKKMKDISVINDVTARNIWMEDLYLFNCVKQLKPEEVFHAPEAYALRWQPPGGQFMVLIPLKDVKVQENVISYLSKLPKIMRDNIIFYFTPVTPGKYHCCFIRKYIRLRVQCI